MWRHNIWLRLTKYFWFKFLILRVLTSNMFCGMKTKYTQQNPTWVKTRNTSIKFLKNIYCHKVVTLAQFNWYKIIRFLCNLLYKYEYLKNPANLWRLLFGEVENVNSATSAYDIYDLPAFADKRWEHSTIRCIHVTQNKLSTAIPIQPTHKPASDTALGNASIPAPMFPFTIWIIVWTTLKIK